MPNRLTDEQLTELERLADEDRRWGVFTHPDYARAAREAVPALIAEVRRLRAALQERLVTEWRFGHRVYYQCDECGQRADAPEHIEHIACPLSDAAIAERGGKSG